MHELFLSASVDSEEVPQTLRILQGYCGMIPQALIHRRLIFEGPRTRKDVKGLDAAFVSKQPPNKLPLWKSLNEALARQSYVLTLIYDVDRNQFGQPAKETDGEEGKFSHPLDSQLGTLRWNDLPDPSNAMIVNSRLAVTIGEEKSLCELLQANGQSFTREIIQECHRLVHNNVVFTLSRFLEIPPGVQEVDGHSRPKINSKLPPYESLEVFDAGDKWILTVSVEVANGNDPVHMKSGMEELMTVKEDLKGCFALKPIDRLILDTKVKMQQS